MNAICCAQVEFIRELQLCNNLYCYPEFEVVHLLLQTKHLLLLYNLYLPHANHNKGKSGHLTSDTSRGSATISRSASSIRRATTGSSSSTTRRTL